MDSDNIPADLRDAFRAMQRQVEAAQATWITALAEHRPDLADQLWKLHNHDCYKHERLEVLRLLCIANSALPIEAMLLEYGAVLDTIDSDERVQRDEEDSAGDLGSRQRSGRTKRLRTRENLIAATIKLITENRVVTAPFAATVAELSGVSLKTLYHHFATKDELLAAAYARLLEPLISQI